MDRNRLKVALQRYLVFYQHMSTLHQSSSSSRMHVINHNWSATKQHLHPQSVAEISRHSVLSGDRIRQCETSSGSRHKDTTISVCKSPFPSAGTAVSLFCAKTVQQRPLLPRKVETWLPDCVSGWKRVSPSQIMIVIITLHCTKDQKQTQW